MQIYPLVLTLLYFALLIHVKILLLFCVMLPAEQSTIASTNSTRTSGKHFSAMYFSHSH